VHRADGRSFDHAVAERGLKAKGGDASFKAYVDENSPSKYIGAFADHEAATGFAKAEGRNVYNIHPGEGEQRLGEGVNPKYKHETGEDNEHEARENEHVFTDEIPLHMIHSHVDTHGQLHHNPHYVPPEHRPPRGK
jgi:hypothetical protein